MKKLWENVIDCARSLISHCFNEVSTDFIEHAIKGADVYCDNLQVPVFIETKGWIPQELIDWENRMYNELSLFYETSWNNLLTLPYFPKHAYGTYLYFSKANH